VSIVEQRGEGPGVQQRGGGFQNMCTMGLVGGN